MTVTKKLIIFLASSIVISSTLVERYTSSSFLQVSNIVEAPKFIRNFEHSSKTMTCAEDRSLISKKFLPQQR